MIWEELLKDIRVEEGAERRHGVLISRDEKTDWVSSAPLIKTGEKPPQKSNRDVDLDVTRAHPLLVHEFVGRARGESLYVVPPGFLASALDYGARKAGRPGAVPNWLSAAHRPDLVGHLAGAELLTASLAPPTPISPTAARTGTVASTAPVEYSYPSAAELMRLPVAEEAGAYFRAKPADRPGLVQSWREQLVSGAMAAERFGRLLAYLGLRGRTEWLTQLPAVVEQLRTQILQGRLNGVVLGATVPAYFDEYGEALRRPQRDLGVTAFLLERDPQLAPAFTVLAGFLAGAGVELPYVPGSGRRKIWMILDAVDGGGGLRTLRDLRVGEESVLADELASESPRRFSTLLGRERADGCTGRELRALLAREFLVPVELLSADYDKKRYTWLPDAGLVSLDTLSPGGISATVTDEEEERG